MYNSPQTNCSYSDYWVVTILLDTKDPRDLCQNWCKNVLRCEYIEGSTYKVIDGEWKCGGRGVEEWSRYKPRYKSVVPVDFSLRENDVSVTNCRERPILSFSR